MVLETKTKKLLTALLTLLLMLVLMPVNTLKAESAATNDFIYWGYNSTNHELIISSTSDFENGYTEKGCFSSFGAPNWKDNEKLKSDIIKVTISKEIKPYTTIQWFDGFSMLMAIDGIDKIDTSRTTDTSGMFKDCSFLGFTSEGKLDLTNFDTSNVGIMSDMFNGCSKLSSILVSSKWDVKNVSGSENMFLGCTSLPNYNENNVDKTPAVFDDYGYLTLGAYFIRYNANGGTGEMAESKVSAGSPFTLPKNNFTNGDKVFKGWSYGLGVLYSDQQTLSAAQVADAAGPGLFAEWADNVCEVRIGKGDAVKYTSLTEALEVANRADSATITMISNVSKNNAEKLEIAPDVVLDLNGYDVYANEVTCFGSIKDSSEEYDGQNNDDGPKGGLYVLSNKFNYLGENSSKPAFKIESNANVSFNEKMSTFDTASGDYHKFIFYTVTHFTQQWITPSSGLDLPDNRNTELVFKPVIFTKTNEAVKNAFKDTSGVKMYLQVKYHQVKGPSEEYTGNQIIEVAPQIVSTWLASADISKVYIKFGLNFPDGTDGAVVTPYIKSEKTGLTLTGPEMPLGNSLS